MLLRNIWMNGSRWSRKNLGRSLQSRGRLRSTTCAICKKSVFPPAKRPNKFPKWLGREGSSSGFRCNLYPPTAARWCGNDLLCRKYKQSLALFRYSASPGRGSTPRPAAAMPIAIMGQVSPSICGRSIRLCYAVLEKKRRSWRV